MNYRAVRILFLKDLFLARKFLFGYFTGGLVACAMAGFPDKTVAFIGFIMMITVAIAAGIHFIGNLLLGESIDQTRSFIMSLPVSLLDYSIGKISVVLTTFMIPWTAMFASSFLLTFVLPWAKHGSVVILPPIFLFLLCTFTLQLVIAVITESIGWTIGVMVACNVGLNLFLMKLYAVPEVEQAVKSETISWPAVIVGLTLIELLFVVATIGLAFVIQTRKRDLI